ncbi:MAG: type I glyceraldehyde-3-phosphate dehydrogenase [Anaerolineae bacterium]
MPVTIGLMGFGRIGRNIFRIAYDRSDIRVGAISDIADPEALTYLLRYDTILGRFPDKITYKDGYLYTIGKEIPFLSGRDPGDVDWSAYGVDYVIEATARDRPLADFRKHIDSGARRVVLCVPTTDKPDRSIVFGVNDEKLRQNDLIISNASCTAHCAAPVLKILSDAFAIEQVHLTSVHAFTSVQRLADVPAHELRMSRAAAMNIVPSDTNAGHVIEEVLPRLAGRIHASALRVPVPNGSIVDMTIGFKEDISAGRINEVVRTAAAGPYSDILEFAEDPIVSSDVAVCPYSSVYDSLATMVLEDRIGKVIAWFDNSWGYSHRVVDLVFRCAAMDGLIEEGT